jgi:hypothetical protein
VCFFRNGYEHFSNLLGVMLVGLGYSMVIFSNLLGYKAVKKRFIVSLASWVSH